MGPNRRAVLAAALWAAGAVAAQAHTPFRQWVVYRRKHLLIGAHRGDGRTYDLAKEVAAALAEALPDASARVARGPRPERLASLLGTGQLMTAVLGRGEARAMTRADAPFENYEPVALRALAELAPGYVLAARPDFPHDHAWLVTEALDREGLARRPRGAAPRPHPAAAAYWRGEDGHGPAEGR